MIETSAPGKLYIAGEYAVVQPGYSAVIVAVNKFMHIRLQETTGQGEIRTYGGHFPPITWKHDANTPRFMGNENDYAANALKTVEKLREELHLAPKHYTIDILSELVEKDGRKYGLGSSAALTVAIIDAIAQLYRITLTRLDVYKLAMIAVVSKEPKASGGDIAAAAFRGWVLYTSPDREELRQYAQHTSISDMLTAAHIWGKMRILQLPAPTEQFLVGWTGTPASTQDAVNNMIRAAKEKPQKSQEDLGTFLRHSEHMVEGLVENLRAGNSLYPSIRTARSLLQGLARDTGTIIETPRLTQLAQLAEQCGGVGKSSGAGGGDCGIAFLSPDIPSEGLQKKWRQADIQTLDLHATPPIAHTHLRDETKGHHL